MNWFRKQASDTQITHGERIWLYLIASIIMFLLIFPTIIVIPMSFSESQYLEFPPKEWSLRWYNEYWETPRWINATVTSLKVAFFTIFDSSYVVGKCFYHKKSFIVNNVLLF